MRLLLLLIASCGGRAERPRGSPDTDADSDTDTDTDTGPDTGTPKRELRIDDVFPSHGPTSGGNSVIVEGDGFGERVDLLTVRFGVNLVRPWDLVLLSDRSLRVEAVPPGPAGPVDVAVSSSDPSADAILPGGYHYDAFRVDPPRGSTEGGTGVRLFGVSTVWDASAVVTFDGAPATDCEVQGAMRLDCRTPPGEAGTADVRVADASGKARYDDLALDAFEYVEASDTFPGGLGGGPIEGHIEVTVLGTSLLPLEGAFVMLGTDGATPFQGLTDALGQIVFEDDALVGRQQISAGKESYESAGFVGFDAREVTIVLEWATGGIAVDPFPSPISGDVVFEGPDLGPNPWTVIPDPVDPAERKECRVQTTRHTVAWYRIDPVVVTEDDANAEGAGYSYETAAFGGTLAVWAICGLANTETDTFLPYVFGVRRDVIVAGWEASEGLDVVMDIPLDHLTVVQLEDAPPAADPGPDHYRADVALDLGEEGYITREDASVWSIDPRADLRFAAQPPLVGAISDARWVLVGGAYTGEGDSLPMSAVIETGVDDTSAPIVLGDFVGVPVQRVPAAGGIAVDGRIAWEAPGGTPTFTRLVLDKRGDPHVSAWDVIVNGDRTEVTLPDLAAIGSLPEPPSGPLGVRLGAARIDGLSFDDFRYSDLDENGWEAWAAADFDLALR